MQSQHDLNTRIVLLGASNLTRGISTVLGTARRLLGPTKQVFVAYGHGRSYGVRSRVLIRELPGILNCGLWSALEAAPAWRTYALITDIGNDLMYGSAPAQLGGWIERCVERLAERQARVIITGLPLESVRRLRPVAFRVVRSILFPGRSLDLPAIIARAEHTQELLMAIANRYAEVTFVTPRSAWYGVDAIHLRMPCWPRAWRELLAPWSPNSRVGPAPGNWRRWLAVRGAMPEHCWLGSQRLARTQPARRGLEGVTLWFY